MFLKISLKSIGLQPPGMTATTAYAKSFLNQTIT
jgi:hypothetical protein